VRKYNLVLGFLAGSEQMQRMHTESGTGLLFGPEKG